VILMDDLTDGCNRSPPQHPVCPGRSSSWSSLLGPRRNPHIGIAVRGRQRSRFRWSVKLPWLGRGDASAPPNRLEIHLASIRCPSVDPRERISWQSLDLGGRIQEIMHEIISELMTKSSRCCVAVRADHGRYQGRALLFNLTPLTWLRPPCGGRGSGPPPRPSRVSVCLATWTTNQVHSTVCGDPGITDGSALRKESGASSRSLLAPVDRCRPVVVPHHGIDEASSGFDPKQPIRPAKNSERPPKRR